MNYSNVSLDNFCEWLIKKRKDFENKFKDDCINNQELLKTFLNDWPLERLKNISLDEYIELCKDINTGGRFSNLYMSIGGGTPATKFLISQKMNKNGYKIKNGGKEDTLEEEAATIYFNELRKDLVDILQKGINLEFDEIKSTNRFFNCSAMIIKLLSIYSNSNEGVQGKRSYFSFNNGNKYKNIFKQLLPNKDDVYAQNHEITKYVDEKVPNLDQVILSYSIHRYVKAMSKNDINKQEREKKKMLYSDILKKYGYDLNELYEMEPDAGLGNGGLGRLAACFMDSLASLNYPATGFSILYEYGLFRQKIVEGWQIELPDVWLPGGEVWLSPRTDKTFVVKFGGRINETWTDEGLVTEQVDCEEVEAVPYDMMISGADSKGVSVLRVWRSRDIDTFDMNSFSRGDYARATLGNNKAELISKVLYPRDSHYEGKELRLKQQYFLVSASAQNIIADHMKYYPTLDNFADKVAIHINDTHPAMIVPELMRIFMDEHHYSWDDAFAIITKTLAYTNHTVLAEALEKWPEDMMMRLLPRIYQIIHELNERHCKRIFDKFSGDWNKCAHMALISGGLVHMANLSIIVPSKETYQIQELHLPTSAHIV